MAKDWTGNKRSKYATLGASNHSDYTRAENDYYATEPIAIDMLAQTGFLSGVKSVWECASGGGHLVRRMEELGKDVYASDLYNHNFAPANIGVDFLACGQDMRDKYDAIVTNPPYKYALEFCKKAIDLAPKTAMFLKLTFLEGAKRQPFFKASPPRYVAVCVNRVQCAINGDKDMFSKSSAACYAWFIWERGYTGRPEILWITKKEVEF